MTSLEDWFNSSLKDIDHEEFNNVVKVNLKLESMGDGQVVVISEVRRAILTLETRDGQTKNLKVILKTEPTSEAAKSMAALGDIFETETMMYSDILKNMEKLMLHENMRPLWAECYTCGDNKFVFQDLCEIGYRVVPTHKFLDFDHTVLVMKSIGQFHGLSLVMKERNLLDVNKIKPCFYAERLPFLINIMKLNIGLLATSMKTSWGPEWFSAAERLEKYSANPGDDFYEMCESVKGKWCVLNHGDFSMRNMLFHYPNDSSTPDFVKFVDFQGCHYSNFGFDLATLLYSSVRPKLREDNLKIFLETYVESLRSTCLSFGYEGELPTLKEVYSSLNELSYLTTTTSFLNIPFFISSKYEGMQEQADGWFEKLASEEVPVDTSDEQEGIKLFSDSEIITEMKFEVQRVIEEGII